MVVDTSALMAIFIDEPDAAEFEDAIDADPMRLISMGTVLECSIVLEARFGEAGVREFDYLLHRLSFTLTPVDGEQMEWGRLAFRNYGKGRHRAGLNFGDCFAYGLSKVSGEPLLFKGDDFSRTDVRAARSSPP
jgi:ribonuclease VapC